MLKGHAAAAKELLCKALNTYILFHPSTKKKLSLKGTSDPIHSTSIPHGSKAEDTRGTCANTEKCVS